MIGVDNYFHSWKVIDLSTILSIVAEFRRIKSYLHLPDPDEYILYLKQLQYQKKAHLQ